MILSPSRTLAFVPRQTRAAQNYLHRHSPAASSSSRLPSSLSYAQDADDSNNGRPKASASASAATTYPPPAPGRSTSDDDGNGNDLQQSISSAKSILEARTEEINALRSSQAEQLVKISELTASLASSHAKAGAIASSPKNNNSSNNRNNSKNNNLIESQAELSQGLDAVSKLIAEVSDVGSKLREVEVLRMEAVAALEDAESIAATAAANGSVVVEEDSADKVLDDDLDAVEAIIYGTGADTAEPALQVSSHNIYISNICCEVYVTWCTNPLQNLLTHVSILSLRIGC